MSRLLWNKVLLLAVASCFVCGSCTVSKFTPGVGCGITMEMKVVSGKGEEEVQGDQRCTLRTYLDKPEIGLFGTE